MPPSSRRASLWETSLNHFVIHRTTHGSLIFALSALRILIESSMKKVAIVNGIVNQVKYNQHLAKKYEALGYAAKEFSFPFALLFRCEQHHKLEDALQQIVSEHDVIHCQSGGCLPVLHHYYDRQHTKPFILETPVLRSSTGTLFSAMGWSKSYDSAPDLKVVQKLLDTFCFTPEWKESTLQRLGHLKERRLILTLGSTADNVSDNRGLEHLLDHHLDKGKHARLFYENDFDLVEAFLRSHPHHK